MSSIKGSSASDGGDEENDAEDNDILELASP